MVGRGFGTDVAVHVTVLAPSIDGGYISLSVLIFQLLTAMVCFLLIYRVLALGALARVAAKHGVVIESQSTFRGMLLSAFIPLLVWAVGMALMMDLARSGMHDSM
jgi:hypothetical protein